MTRELILKVEFEGDLRRFRIHHKGSDAACWDELRRVIHTGFELSGKCEMVLKYRDEEDDLCTLARATLSDCLAQSPNGVLRLCANRVDAPADGRASVDDNEHCGEVEVCLPQKKDDDILASPQAGCNNVVGWRGIGPWKLLMCLGSLHAVGKMSASMVASMVLQFLPTLALRAHRKQEKLNHVGREYREMLLPVLRRVILHLGEVEDGASVKSSLEAFVTGKDASKFGDAITAMLKVLAASPSRCVVAQLLKGAGPELADLLPKVFPDSFHAACPPIVSHAGVRCCSCGTKPLVGPRFHSISDGQDLCGDCFIDFSFDATSKFECRLNVGPAEPSESPAGDDSVRAGVIQAFLEASSKWKNIANTWAGACKGGMKGKGKGKWVGKDKGGAEPTSTAVDPVVHAWAPWPQEQHMAFWGARCPPEQQWPSHAFPCTDTPGW